MYVMESTFKLLELAPQLEEVGHLPNTGDRDKEFQRVRYYLVR